MNEWINDRKKHVMFVFPGGQTVTREKQNSTD